jgi:type IV secretory pathway TrbD component
MRKNRSFDGFEVPFHQSITEVLLMAGLPRTVALILWTSAASLAFGMRQLWILPFAVLLHIILSACTRNDPHFFDIFIRAVKTPKRLDP